MHPYTRRRAPGFTIVELMMALVIGALLVSAVVSLGGASARHFHEQQRIGQTQRSVRVAIDRVRRDIARAGYLSVPDTTAPGTRMCPSPAAPRVRAIQFTNDDAAGNAVLDTVNRARNRVSADRVRVTGNFATSDAYLVDSFDAAGTRVYLQPGWLGFRRSFVNGTGASAVVDTARYQDVFRTGRMLHVETPNGFHYMAEITGSTVNAAGTIATVSISPGVGNNPQCLQGFGRGSIVSPISQIEYSIGAPAAGSVLIPRSVEVTGPNTILFRQELDMRTNDPIAGTRRPVLEYAIDFNLDFVLDTAAPPAQPNLVRRAGPDAQGPIGATPWQVRTAIISLAARTAEQDPRFPWPADWAGGRRAGDPLNRFQVYTDRLGAARVRSSTAEVQIPNLLPIATP